MTAPLDRIREAGVVAVLRGVDPDRVVPVAEALCDGGVRAVEVTADTPGLTDLVADLATAVGDRAAVGAGTVLDAATARGVLAAGGEFVVSPSFHPPVVEACHRAGALAVPGVMTPTEAVRAAETGAGLLKLFPAATLGPGHLRALRGPLGHLPFLPTGGIDPDNAGAFVAAGAVGVGAGSALVDPDAVERGDYAALTDRAERLVDAVAAARE